MSPPRVTGEAAAEIRQPGPDGEFMSRRPADVNYLIDEGLAAVLETPGVAESIDWPAVLKLLEIDKLSVSAIDRILGSVKEHPEDQEVVRAVGLEPLILSASG